jgi:hypothetical protein
VFAAHSFELAARYIKNGWCGEQTHPPRNALCRLVPASTAIKAATAQHQNNKNYEQNCGDIHMRLL